MGTGDKGHRREAGLIPVTPILLYVIYLDHARPAAKLNTVSSSDEQAIPQMYLLVR